MTNETKLWQLRAGLITEGEYQESIEELDQKLTIGNTKPGAPSQNQPEGAEKVNSVQKLRMYFRDLGSGKAAMPVMDPIEVEQLHRYITDYINKAGKGSIGAAAKTTKRTFDTGTKSVKV